MQHKILPRIIVPLCLLIVNITNAAPKIDQMFQEYNTSKNGHSRAQIIRALSKNASIHNESEIVTIEKLIHEGLNDKRPEVVEEAIFAAGKFRRETFSPVLHELYRNGCNQYPGNQTVIKQKIIRAFSKIGGNEKDKLFVEELNRKTVCQETQMILSSILDNEKCSKTVILSVISLKDAILNVLSRVKDTPENSIKYSQHHTIISLSNAIIRKNTLSE
jgi:hypothetical protein